MSGGIGPAHRSTLFSPAPEGLHQPANPHFPSPSGKTVIKSCRWLISISVYLKNFISGLILGYCWRTAFISSAFLAWYLSNFLVSQPLYAQINYWEPPKSFCLCELYLSFCLCESFFILEIKTEKLYRPRGLSWHGARISIEREGGVGCRPRADSPHSTTLWCGTEMSKFEPGLPDCYQDIVVKVER